MSSIPLPALQARPPEQTNLLGQAAQAMQLRGQQQQQQSQQLAIQQQQQQLKDQQSMTAAFKDWDGKDPQELIKGVIGKGGSAQAVVGLQSHIIQQKETYSKIAADDATTGAKNLETMKGKNDMVLGQLNSLKDVPDAQLGQALNSSAQDMLQKGLIDPQHAQQMTQAAQAGDPVRMRQSLEMGAKQYQSQSMQMEQASKQATIAKDKSQSAQADAETTKINLENQQLQKFGGLSPAAADARYRFVQQKINQGRTVSADDSSFAKAYEKEKTLASTNTFNLQNSGISGQGGQPSALAQAVAKGDMKWTDVISPRTPMSVKQQFAQEVKTINPNFNSGDFSVEQAAKTTIAKGEVPKNIGDQKVAFNTAMQHADLLDSAASALKNGDVQALNSLSNKFKNEFGESGPITATAIANAYGREVTSVLAKGHMTDSEIGTTGKTIDPTSQSYPQIHAVLGAYKSLAQSKLNMLNAQEKAALDRTKTGSQPASPNGGFNWDNHPKVKQ